MSRSWRGLTTLVAIVVVAAGCGVSSRPSLSAVATLASPSEPVSSSTGTPATAAPPPTGRPSPTPEPGVQGWSKPTLIRSGDCSQLTAAIDSGGHAHVAAVCDGGIRYLASEDGTDWKETSFVPGIDSFELDPQLTLDGSTVYIAYSLLAPTGGGCGSNGLEDVGVYTRSLGPSDAAWSDPVQVGAKGDRVQSFRVVDGVLHLIVTAKNGAGPLYYESQSGHTFTAVPIPGGIAGSVRVGDDGRARIGYTTGHAIRYASVDGTRLSIATLSATDQTNLKGPLLVLAPGNRAYLAWVQDRNDGRGCVALDPGPLDGVYIATDAGGRWKITRLTRAPGEASFALDPASGRVELAMSDGSSVTQLTSGAGDTWTTMKIAGTRGLRSPLIRLNPVTGRATIFALGATGISTLTQLGK
jgi:hypothetical protein